MDYDYESIIKENCVDLVSVKEKVIEAALAHIVTDEINAVHLSIGGTWYTVSGVMGSEVMGFAKRKEQFCEEQINEVSRVCRLPILEQFIGEEIVEVRQIGKASNGHGFELSFRGVPDRTLILQSIYTGAEPEDLVDCMRIGVGTYVYQIPEPSQ